MYVCVYVSHVLDRKLLERLMSPKSQVMFASAFSWIGDLFRIFGIHSFYTKPTLLNIWIWMQWADAAELCTHACSSAVSRVSRMLHAVAPSRWFPACYIYSVCNADGMSEVFIVMIPSRTNPRDISGLFFIAVQYTASPLGMLGVLFFTKHSWSRWYCSTSRFPFIRVSLVICQSAVSNLNYLRSSSCSASFVFLCHRCVQ